MYVQHHYKEYSGVAYERPERIDWILDYVTAKTVPLNEEEALKAILKVHPQEYMEKIKELSRNRIQLREDLNFEPGLYKVALNAVNTSLKAAFHKTLAIVRPPGHHASQTRAEGFCYFNNLIIASENIYQGKRIAIIDFDAHYGNGTHRLIKDKENYFYVSVHADTNFSYPGERIESENSFLIDVLPAETDDKTFLELWKKALEQIKSFNPEIIAISMGFDTWYDDPVLGFNVRFYGTYRKLGEMIKSLNVPFFGVLEGGYDKRLGKMFQAFAQGLGINTQDETITKEVLTFNKDPGKQYLLNEAGEIWEFETKAKKIGEIEKKPGYNYEIVKDKVVEKKVLPLTLEEFYKKKNTGELKRLYRMGYHIEIKEEDLSLGEMDKLYQANFIKELEGRIIEKVEVKRDKGNIELTLFLDNGKKLILKEGLLIGGSKIELE